MVVCLVQRGRRLCISVLSTGYRPCPRPAGERFAGSSDPATRAAAAAIRAAEAEELAEQRRAKKAAFDAEYDAGRHAQGGGGRAPC